MKDNQNETPQKQGFLGESALEGNVGGQFQKAPGFGAAPPPVQGKGIVQRTQEEDLASNTSLAANHAGQDGNVHITADFQAKVAAFQTAIAGAADAAAMTAIVQSHATQLWDYATAQIRGAGTPSHGDDGPSYVARLQMRTVLRNASQLAGNTAEINRLIGVLETFSRGADASQISFAVPASEQAAVGDEPVKKILISGFDPFFPDVTGEHEIAVSNPSGAAAMALDGVVIHGSNTHAVIQTVTFPVRYADFDQGMVERTFKPYLAGPDAVDMVVTMSLDPNTDDTFNIEGYGTANRQGWPDNEGRYNVPAADRHYVESSNIEDTGMARGNAPHGNGAPNYITTQLPWLTILRNLPAGGYDVQLRTKYNQPGSDVADRATELQSQAMSQAVAREGVTVAEYREIIDRHLNGTVTPEERAMIQRVEALTIQINHQLNEIEISTIAPGSQEGDYFSDDGVSSTNTMESGSGGSYLSNEIFYRTGRLAGDMGSTVPFGHIHVPNNRSTGTFDTSLNDAIRAKVEEIVRASLPAL
jgi:hypothetical protein